MKIFRKKKKQKFHNALYALEKYLTVDAIEKRKINNNKIVDHIHDELAKKIAAGDLSKYSIQQLIDLNSKVSGESRQDDKNTLPQKTQHEEVIKFASIKDRWNLSRNRELVKKKFESGD